MVRWAKILIRKVKKTFSCQVIAIFHFCHHILIDIKGVNLRLILVFKVFKTSVYSENGK